jgi:hypothetical protein
MPEMQRTASIAGRPADGGAEGTRTPDPLVANEVRYQLRHSPVVRQQR